jgi:uncharacterized protein YdeI (YjbR/CyaY-like superfamily)
MRLSKPLLSVSLFAWSNINDSQTRLLSKMPIQTRRRSSRVSQREATSAEPITTVKTTIAPSKIVKSTRDSKELRQSKQAAPPRPVAPKRKSAADKEELTVADAAAWRAWLEANEDISDGVWLILSKKGSKHPTSLTRTQALDEALCSGWIDGQGRSISETNWKTSFTPRRKKSLWSMVNVRLIERLRTEGRMRERGEQEVRKAQDDGRWEKAYAGPSNMTVPEDVEAALGEEATGRLREMKNMDRYTLLLPIVQTQSDATRQKKIRALVEQMANS